MPSYGVKSKSLRAVLHTLLSDDVPKISVQDAVAQTNNVLFIDAREKEEYDVSHLPGARFVGFKKFTAESLANVSKDKELIVYCSIGKRSDAIAKKLADAGFTHVHNLFGGIFEWVNQGNAVYRNEIVTNEVHAYNHLWGRWLEKGAKVY